MRFASFVLLALGVLQPAGAPFETAIPPGEGRPRLRAAGTLQLRDLPELKRPVTITLNVPPTRDLVFDETVYRTVVPGTIKVRTATTISGRVMGPIRLLSRDDYYKGAFPRRHIAVTPANLLEYLQYRAEGTCFVRIDRDVVDAENCPATDKQAFVLVTEPTIEWWVRILRESERPGWVLVDGTRVKVVGRAF